MSPSRRIYLYWILLLVPTLVAGGVALQLLRREEGRLRSGSKQVEEARRSALAARARLVVENLELLAGDVENALLDTLAAAPESRLDDFLSGWPARNPLVRNAFLCTAEGSLLFPSGDGAGEMASGFRRRFDALFRTTPPWQSGGRPEGERKTIHTAAAMPGASGPSAFLSTLPSTSSSAKAQPSQEVLLQSNTAQVQSARRDLQQMARASNSASRVEEARESSIGTARYQQPALTKLSKVPAPVAAERRGWTPVALAGRRHILGWLQPSPQAAVRGLELDIAALAPRLQALLPGDLAEGESLVLLDERRNVLHSTGAGQAADSPPVLSIPVGSTVLSGWAVEARLLPAAYGKSSGDSAFFLVGALLVGILCIAVLAGGSLLLLQARASALDAVQKASFVSNVSHEFKTPLTTIRLYAELLEQRRVSDPEKRDEYLRTISRETQRLARLVGNALDFSRLEQGRKRFAVETLDLAAEASRIAEAQRPRLLECGLAPAVSIPAVPVLVRADRDALEQILLNLLDNACKYAASGGVLALGVHPGGGALLTVDDRGPGVPEDQRERIFEKFHRLNDRLTAEQGGVGLGLSIARRLARGLGGELSCTENPGGGARFVLRLPGVADPTGTPASSPSPADATTLPKDQHP